MNCAWKGSTHFFTVPTNIFIIAEVAANEEVDYDDVELDEDDDQLMEAGWHLCNGLFECDVLLEPYFDHFTNLMKYVLKRDYIQKCAHHSEIYHW